MTVFEPARPRRRTIARRLAAAVATVFVVIGLGATACLWAIFDIHGRLHVLKKDEEQARSVVLLASAVRDQYAHAAHAIVVGDDSHERLFADSTARLQSLAAALRTHRLLEGSVEIGRILSSSMEMERIFRSEVLPAVKSGDRTSLAARHERIMELAFTAQQQADSLAGKIETSMDDLSRHVRATQHGVILIAIGALALALLTAPLSGVYLYRTIARPIATISDAAARVAHGDLDTRIVVERDDELGCLSRNFNEMVSATKEHQKRLLQNERLVGLASMSAGIAHELNNPIGVILGYAKLLRRGGTGADQTMLAAIEEEAERCHQVIEGLLELTRGAVFDRTAVDLRALAEETIKRLRTNGAPAVAAVEIHGHATASGDPAKLRQVLTNVLRNAFEASGAAGRVVVSIDEPNPSLVSVDVRDSGSGVSDAARDRLFEPFFTTKPTGSGLGLAISRAIARAHGGDLVLVSTTEGGSTFRLTVQASKEVA